MLPPEAKIARMMALSAIKDMENNNDKVAFLRSAGFAISEMAAMLNIVESQVRVALARSQKKKRKKRG
jgi:hypothetical protein